MRERRRLIAVSFSISVLCLVLVPSSAQAGPLLDWLFQRNRSQGLAGAAYGAASNPTAANLAYGASNAAANGGYGTNLGAGGYAANGYGAGRPGGAYGSTSGYRGTGGAAGGGSLLSKCCLFGGGRTGLAARSANSANGLAANQANGASGAAANRVTAAYGGTGTGGSCGQGWCQQTVLRYVPQVAYRTAYQPVPVTTYKTSTTINPQNGLPRTCTRPCTSYTYQARRVPYTTYRPVYTQVPVTDDGFAGGAATAPTQAPSQAPAYAPQPTYALQPTSPPNTAGGCSSCQNNGGFQAAAPGFRASPYGNASPYSGIAPGYTPGNAPLPPDPQAGPWTNQPLAPPTSFGGAQPTPWRTVGPAAQSGQSYGDPGGWQRANAADGYSDNRGQQPTAWGAVPSDGVVTPPASFSGGSEADRRPSLRIDSDEYYDNYSESNRSNRLKPVPMPENIRRRLQNQPSSEFLPDSRIDGQGDTTRNDPYGDRSFDQYSAARQTVESRRPEPLQYDDLDDRLFSTPQRPVTSTQKRPAAVEQPRSEFNETRRRRPFDSRAIRDVERTNNNVLPNDDKTAGSKTRRSPRTNNVSTTTRGVMPMLEDDNQATRYAATPITWPSQQEQRSDRNSRGWPTETNRALKWQVR